MVTPNHLIQARPVTKAPLQHWVGYHDLCPWDASGRYLLSCATDMSPRPLRPDDTAFVGCVDLQDDNTFRMIAEVSAFNWQTGCRAQWLAGQEPELIFNTTQDGIQTATIANISTGEQRHLPVPIYQVSPDGASGVTINYTRLLTNLPGYGYYHKSPLDGPVDEDGLIKMNLSDGETELLLSLAALASHQTREGMQGANHWVSTPTYSPDGSQIAFLHRWKAPSGGTGELVRKARRLLGPLEVPLKRLVLSLPRQLRATAFPHSSRLYCINADGSNLRLLADEDMVSHFCWYGTQTVIAWSYHAATGDRYHLYNVATGDRDSIGSDLFDGDGHPAVSPDEKWFVTDTYPDSRSERALALYSFVDGSRINIGHFYSPPELRDTVRCDLHPRWNRDGSRICFDSAHEGARQVYVMDVDDIVDRSTA